MTSKIGLSSEYQVAFNKHNWKPLCYMDDQLLVFNKGKLILLDLNNYESKLICVLNSGVLNKHLLKSRLLTRLLRLEPRGVLKIDTENVLIPLKGKLYHLDIKTKKVEKTHDFRKEMSAPLNMTKIENVGDIQEMYCYGEYFSNPDKKEVSIWGCKNNCSNWEEVYKFKKGQINHIHSIVPDPYQNLIWILTGDYGDSAGIWYTEDGFKTVNKFLTGKQKYRSCVAFPTAEGLLYATDTPLEKNHIYLLSANKKKKILYNLEGSSIYGQQSQENYIFSSTVEGHSDGEEGMFGLLSYNRGKGIKSWYSELVIGNVKEGFQRIVKFKKDLWPMGLMQFGTIIFPSGHNRSNKIIIYGSGLEKIDGKLLILEKRSWE